jgi:23S rRNA (uracil1939-C5)-methyltransferase
MAPPLTNPCPHYPDCVPCPLIGQAYGEQLRSKREQVRLALDAYPRLASIDVPEVVGSKEAFGYRNQAKLVVRRTRSGVLLGVYRPGTHRVADVRRCATHHPLIEPILEAVAGIVEELDIPAYDERDHSGCLRYVVVRVAVWNRTAQVILVTKTKMLPNNRQVVRALQRVRGVESVVQNVNPEPGNVILGPTFMPLTKVDALIDKVGPFKLRTRPGAFLQANIGVARRIYRQTADWIAPRENEVVVDLYCGAGALTFHLAATAKLAVGIEESPVAVVDAKANVRLNGISNARFRAGDSGEVLPELHQAMGRIDVITLNPPRSGASTATRQAIFAAAPARIGYVSCDPRTLARDLDWLIEHGYEVTHLQPFDLLPQTEHVECVAALRRRDATK